MTSKQDAATELECIRFGPIDVEFDTRVLRPREWTLMQSEWAAELARSAAPGPILELCAGAGHIGTAAAVLSGRDLVQVELDPVAASLAERNAARNGVRTEVRVGRLQDVLGVGELFPLVIADPPYLPSAETDEWPDDPVLAIDGGPDGLDLQRACLTVAACHLAPGGTLLLQVAGADQARAIATELPQAWTVADERSVDARRAVMRIEGSAGRAS
jgi:release factor glutamine methyltransferase